MDDYDWKWAFVVALLIGGWLYFDASGSSIMSKTLEERGKPAKGMIVGGHEQSSRRSSHYYVEVQYTPGDRGTKTQKMEVDYDYYKRVGKNMPVEVLYLDEDPLQFKIKGVPLYSQASTTVAFVVLLVGVVGSAWLGFDIWKKKQATA